VVPPKVPQLQLGPGIGPVRPRRAGAPGEEEEDALRKDTFEVLKTFLLIFLLPTSGGS